ncbi:hypothetical protein ABZ848_18760 [Streptomyces sp. NPDC047081]|uniref:hypothetical protein n=1 Tax=Streptomyces sp. NPDC047081 TaxID=3154706 RepID=UPI0033EA9514
MNSPPPPRVNAQDRGLDDAAETERPWSSVGASPAPRMAGADGAPTVTVRYVVVDGPDGEALAQRQAAAIRQVLAWLAAHSDGTDENGASTTRKGRSDQ